MRYWDSGSLAVRQAGRRLNVRAAGRHLEATEDVPPPEGLLLASEEAKFRQNWEESRREGGLPDPGALRLFFPNSEEHHSEETVRGLRVSA